MSGLCIFSRSAARRLARRGPWYHQVPLLSGLLVRRQRSAVTDTMRYAESALRQDVRAMAVGAAVAER